MATIEINKDGIAVEVTAKEIDINALTNQKAILEQEIVDVMPIKKTPDEETLKFWNQFASFQQRRIEANQRLIAMIDAKLSLIDELKK